MFLNASLKIREMEKEKQKILELIEDIYELLPEVI